MDERGTPSKEATLIEAQKILDEAQGKKYSEDQRNKFEKMLRKKEDEKVQKTNQEFFSWLGFNYDLDKEIKEKGFLSLDHEQEQEAIKAGFDLKLIMPDIPRNQFIRTVNAKLMSIFQSQNKISVQLYVDAEQALSKTPMAKQSQGQRFDKPYEIRLKNIKEIEDAHKETLGQPVTETRYPYNIKKGCLKILEELNQQNPHLHLQGLTLTEYLLFQAHSLYQLIKQNSTLSDQELRESINGKMPETENGTWLLEEQIPDYQGKLMRCIDAKWNRRAGGILVGTHESDEAISNIGARLAVLPITKS